MKPEKLSLETYNSIKPFQNGFFMHFPGVYCLCGETFALYSYSANKPDGIDENNKPFYKSCFICNKNNE